MTKKRDKKRKRSIPQIPSSPKGKKIFSWAWVKKEAAPLTVVFTFILAIAALIALFPKAPEKRPWVLHDEVKIVENSNGILFLSSVFKNYGDAPAFKFKYDWHVILIDIHPNQLTNEIFNVKEVLLNHPEKERVVISPTDIKPSTTNIGPDSIAAGTPTIVSIKGFERDLQSGQMFLYAAGTYTYFDTNGQKHSGGFCNYLDPSLKAWITCGIAYESN